MGQNTFEEFVDDETIKGDIRKLAKAFWEAEDEETRKGIVTDPELLDMAREVTSDYAYQYGRGNIDLFYKEDETQFYNRTGEFESHPVGNQLVGGKHVSFYEIVEEQREFIKENRDNTGKKVEHDLGKRDFKNRFVQEVMNLMYGIYEDM